MSKRPRDRTEAETTIYRQRFYQQDSTQLYSADDYQKICEWNERVRSDSGVKPLLVLSEDSLLHPKQTLKRSPLELYCTLQYHLALSKYEHDRWTEVYEPADLLSWMPEIKDKETVIKYLDILDEVGLLWKTRHGNYQRVDDDLGPIFETLATDGEISNTEFDDFPEIPDQSGSNITPVAPLRAWIKRYFWNEHVAGVGLITFGGYRSIQLLSQVYSTGTVSILDLAIAYVLTWILLIGVFALVIGHLRLRAPTALQRDLFSQ
ncbi:hypothetical protein [Halorubrum sp. F4]|uniref:hypothetical protein n=1 Tax=Halorubrum sp. F4 TaxID=2989715 RepID=UPI002480C4B9|nr:hypothetical protein [Halorubrum sp. F4]